MANALFTSEAGTPDVTTTSATVQAPDNASRRIFVWGTFAEAVVDVELSPDGSEWFPLIAFTEKGSAPVDAPPGTYIRAALRMVTAGTRINATYV